MSKKKQTAGERIAGVPHNGDPLYHDMTDVELATARDMARRIDAAIKKAVKADRTRTLEELRCIGHPRVATHLVKFYGGKP